MAQNGAVKLLGVELPTISPRCENACCATGHRSHHLHHRHVGSGAHPRQIMAFDGDEACWQYDSVKNSPGHGVVVHRTHEFRVGPPPGGSTTVASKLRWLRVVAGRGTDLQVIMGLLKS